MLHSIFRSTKMFGSWSEGWEGECGGKGLERMRENTGLGFFGRWMILLEVQRIALTLSLSLFNLDAVSVGVFLPAPSRSTLWVSENRIRCCILKFVICSL